MKTSRKAGVNVSKKITVAELEDKVWTTEGIRVVVRAPQTDLVDDYEYHRQNSVNI